MQILVCVKQVRDPDSPVRIDAAGEAIESAPDAVFRMNRFDEFALEEALRLREKFPDTHIDALSAGPQRAAQTVRRALELGADKGIHLVMHDESYRTPFEVATLIGAYARDRQYDLILTGVMAEDDMQAQVGPMLAEILGYPWATAVMAIRRSHLSGALQVERELEGGRREGCELTLPALLTVQSGINRPRYPALSHMLRARSQALLTISPSPQHGATSVSPPLPRERIVNLEEPAPMQTGLILSGGPEEKAERLLQILRERALL
jgi:electron transfer flavoprotein beta subunit